MAFDLSSATPQGTGKFDLASAIHDAPASSMPAPQGPDISKTESALRSFSQGSTLGYGDEIQAALRAFSPVQINATSTGLPTLGANTDFGQYQKLRDEQRVQNQAAAVANPVTSTIAGVAGAAPAFIAGGGAAVPAALVAGTSALGNASGTAGEQLAEAGKGALIGGTIGAVGKGLNMLGAALRPVNPTLKEVAAGMQGGAKVKAADALAAFRESSQRITGGIGQRVKDAIVGGAVGAVLPGETWKTGATLGFLGINRAVAKKIGASGLANAATTQAANIAQGATGPAAVGLANATTMALQQMSKPQASKAISSGQTQIQAAVQKGQPQYAAEFQALQDPRYRVASTLIDDEDAGDD